MTMLLNLNLFSNWTNLRNNKPTNCYSSSLIVFKFNVRTWRFITRKEQFANKSNQASLTAKIELTVSYSKAILLTLPKVS